MNNASSHEVNVMNEMLMRECYDAGGCMIIRPMIPLLPCRTPHSLILFSFLVLFPVSRGWAVAVELLTAKLGCLSSCFVAFVTGVVEFGGLSH